MNLIDRDFDKNFYFYRMPKKLFKVPYNKLSANAKLCYMLLLSRITLSLKNNYFDDEGNVFIYYTRDNLQKDLNIGKGTAIKVFKELVDVDLIKQVRFNLTFRIYLYDIFENEYELQKVDNKGTISELGDVQKSYLNKNDRSYNNMSKSENLNYEQRDYSNMPDEWWMQFYSN